jgi:hypothetical protein
LYIKQIVYRQLLQKQFDNRKHNIFCHHEIITKANPKMFIEPYQPNKLTTANEIYSEALKNKHNRDVLKKLLDRIKKEL